MSPSGVNDVMRAMQGGIRRTFERLCPVLTTTGTTPHFVLTPTNVSFPAAYVHGEIYAFKADKASAGADDLNINALGAKPLYVQAASGVVAIGVNQIQTNMMVRVAYDSALNGAAGGFQVLNAVPNTVMSSAGAAFTSGSIVYAGASGALTQDNANFFWDSANHRLGIKTASPLSTSAVTVAGSISVTGSDGNFTAGGNRAVIDLSASKARIGSIAGGGAATTTSIMAGTNQEMLQVTATGLGVGGAPAYTLDVTGDTNLTGTMRFSTSPFAIRSGNYNTLYDNAGNQSIFLGNVSDASNYYRNTAHRFGNIGGGVNYFTADGTGFNLQTGTYQVSGTQIALANLSDYQTGTWTPADHSGASLVFTVTDANYVKIGKLVIVSAAITYPTTSSSNNASIQGFPFAAKSGTVGVGGGTISSINGTATTMVWFSLLPGTTNSNVFQSAAAGNLLNRDMSAININFTLHYIAN